MYILRVFISKLYFHFENVYDFLLFQIRWEKMLTEQIFRV